MHYDVVVAGGGPAGSSAARDLARAGIKVLVLEEHAQIGRPLHCSGFVTPRTLTLAGVGDRMVVSQVKGAVVHGPGGARLELGGDKLRAHVLDRPQFDALLAESAQEAGAELLLQSKLAGAERVNGHLALEIQRNGQSSQVTASLLIGADGARSTVARWMGQSPKEMIWAVGAEVELAGQPPEMAQVFVGRTVAPDWFGWTIPIAPGRARIGIGVPYTNGNTKPWKPRHCLDRMVEAFPDEFRGFRVISFSGGFIPLYASIRTYGDRMLLVGDAACQVKPTSGGGIYTSLVAGRLAARTAAEALGAGDTSAKYLARYERAWRRAFGAELERGLDVRRIYKHLGDAELKRVISLLRVKPLQSIIQRDGDIDYPSRMFGFLALASPQLRGLHAMYGFLSSSWNRLLGRPR